MRKAALWLLGVIAVLWFAWQLAARTLDHACLHRLTGVTAEIHPRSLGWNRGQFEVRNLVCSNLNRAGAIITADVPSLLIDYEPLSLFRHQLHVYDMSCEIRMLEIARQERLPRTSGGSRSSGTTHTSVRVDTLRLKLDGSFSYEQQKLSGKMHATLHDVQDIESLRSLFKSP